MKSRYWRIKRAHSLETIGITIWKTQKSQLYIRVNKKEESQDAGVVGGFFLHLLPEPNCK